MVFFGAFLFLLGVLCIWRGLVFLGSLLCTRLGLLRCASCWTRPLGGGRWEHYLCNLWEEYFKVHKTAYKYLGIYVGFMIREPHMLVSVGQHSLHGYYACMVYWTKGALQRNCRLKQRGTSFSPLLVFLFSRNSRERFWGLILRHFFGLGGLVILLVQLVAVTSPTVACALTCSLMVILFLRLLLGIG